MVEVAGTGTGAPLVQVIGPGASGTEVGGMAVRGYLALGILGATDVRLERLWVHDTGTRGLEIRNDLGPTSVTIRDSLIESTVEFAIYASGVDLSVERSVIRWTSPLADGTWGRAINAILGLSDLAPPHLRLQDSVVDGAHEVGVYLAGGDGSITTSVVRGVTAPIGNFIAGGVTATSRADRPATLSIADSAIEQNESLAAACWAASC